jgi:hypothetical protein
MIKNHSHNNRSTPRPTGKVLSFTAKIDITQVRRDNNLILRETDQYEVSLSERELPFAIQFGGRTYILNLSTNGKLPLEAQLD